MKRLPARLPRKVTAQWMSILTRLKRRCKTAMVVNCMVSKVKTSPSGLVLTMKLPVQRSAPMRMTRYFNSIVSEDVSE